MKRRTIITTATLTGLLAAGIAGAAVRANGDSDRPITGDALARATQAALAHTGEGRVTATEVGDEDSMYEVEVTFDDGHQVDVQLDPDFVVVDTIADTDAASDDGDGS